MQPILRPPVGFIIEGKGEYYTYSSLANRILNASNGHFPCSNANGCNHIYENLERELLDLVKAHHPFAIIITVDYVDLKSKCGDDCRELINYLQTKADVWLESTKANGRILDLPERIQVVLQVKKFESWLISDEHGLASMGLLDPAYTPQNYVNADEEVAEPFGHLRRIAPTLNPKKTLDAQTIVAALNVETLEQQSRSFEKFAKELRISFELWQSACAA